jgi:large subunit ribosomal protein L10
MAVTRQQKEEILAELKDKFKRAQSVTFGQYAGMSVKDVSAMRREMRKADVEFKVAKKTLMKLAAKDQGIDLPDEIMEGTVAAVFSYGDPVSGPKILSTTAKKVEALKMLGGMMEGKVMTLQDMKTLAGLPSKLELIAKFMSMLNAPLQNFHGAISAPTTSFARALKAYADKQ